MIFWAGFGACPASDGRKRQWRRAVKEALGTPDSVFLPMVVVDTVCRMYGWDESRWLRSSRCMTAGLTADSDQLSRKVGDFQRLGKLRWPLTTDSFARSWQIY